MNQAVLSSRIENLPEEFKADVLDFIDFLYFKKGKTNGDSDNNKRNGFGCLKGKISLREDFDEPLEDFKCYMNAG